MNTPEQKELWKEILAEGQYPAFRNQLQAQLRRQLRRQRWQRTGSLWAVAASLLALAIVLLRPSQSPPALAPVAHQAPAAPLQRVHSVPLLSSLIRTTAGPEIVRTSTASRTVAHLTDEELLSMFPDAPVALIARTDRPSQLVFLDSAEPK